MNKFLQNFFLFFCPFYPLWGWFFQTTFNKPVELFVGILLLPVSLLFLVYVKKKLPKYLLFFILFTIYHIGSVVINNTFPKDINKPYFFLTDPNILACLLFITAEYTIFDEKFISRMNKCILLVVIISVVVSVIQIQIPTFLFNTGADEDLIFIGQKRNFSIYSWTNLPSIGITFPILISILVSEYDTRKIILPLVIFSCIVVSFLTKTRFIMISAVLVLSQLFFNGKRSITRRASIVVIFLAAVFVMALAATSLGYDINEVINSRILEKDSDMASAKARILSYEVFMLVFPENPWFGVGPATRSDVIKLLGGEAFLIHVGYLSYLYYYGLVGFFLLFFSIFLVLKDAWNAGKRDGFWGSFYGFLAFCLANTTMVYFDFREAGMVLAIIYLRYYRYRASLPLDDEELVTNHEGNEITWENKPYFSGNPGFSRDTS